MIFNQLVKKNYIIFITLPCTISKTISENWVDLNRVAAFRARMFSFAFFGVQMLSPRLSCKKKKKLFPCPPFLGIECENYIVHVQHCAFGCKRLLEFLIGFKGVLVTG